jgi:hypothetical protein
MKWTVMERCGTPCHSAAPLHRFLFSRHKPSIKALSHRIHTRTAPTRIYMSRADGDFFYLVLG